MRNFRFSLWLSLTALAIPLSAGAQVESTPIPAAAKPNFSSMNF